MNVEDTGDAGTTSGVAERIPAAGGDAAGACMASMLQLVLGARLAFADRLDPDVMARAVRELLDIEPVLGCWLDLRARSAEWVRCTDLDSQPVFSLVSSEDPDAEFRAFHPVPFLPKGPRLAVRLVRAPEGDELFVRFDHAAGDGWCAKEIAQLLAETYTALAAGQALPVARVLERPTHGDVYEALTDEQRAAASTPQPAFNASKWRFKPKRGQGSFDYRTLEFDPAGVRALRAYAHARGASLNDALVAGLIRSVAALHPQKDALPAGVSISADPRRFVTDAGLDRVGMIATTQTVLFDRRAGETFDETLAHVVAGVRPYKACLWNLGGSMQGKGSPKPIVLRAIFGTMTFSMNLGRMCALMDMNIGSFNGDRLVFGDARPVRAHVTGVIPNFAGFPLTVSEYRGALTLWVGFRPSRIAAEEIEACLAGIERELAVAEAQTAQTQAEEAQTA